MNNRTPAQSQSPVQATSDLKNQASDLLNQLLDHREQSEARYAEVGGIDPMKSVTGRSAIDRAIETTRNVIHELDNMLGHSSGASADRVAVIETAGRNGHRVGSQP